MEPINITMLNELDVVNSDCVLKVRILRLWRLKDNSKIGQDWSIEMIIQDEMVFFFTFFSLFYYSYLLIYNFIVNVVGQ